MKEFLDSVSEEWNAIYTNNSFDLMTFRDYNITKFRDDFGNGKTFECNERYYVPLEMAWLLKSVNFCTIDIYCAKLGVFSRSDELSTKDFEMLVKRRSNKC